jgi:hypothetical protein
VEQGRPGRCWPGWGRSGTAGAGWGWARSGRRRPGQSGSGTAEEAPARRSGSAAGGAGVRRRRRGAGCSGSARSSCVGGGACRYTARGRDARERSGRKKGRGRVYSLMFIGPTHQPTNISVLAYVTAVVPYVSRPPDEHKLHMSVYVI